MNRICPSEEILSEYMAGGLGEEERGKIEKHLAACPVCRELLVEAYHVINSFDAGEACRTFLRKTRENRWLITSLFTFLASFIFPRHFLQFLAASLLAGAKWIIDSKNTKMLIMIHEAWKDSNKTKKEEVKK